MRTLIMRAPERTVTISVGLLCALVIAGMIYHAAASRVDTSPVADGKARIKKAEEEITQACRQLHDGDLILRSGSDFTSLTLRQFSYHDNTYSHCGIVHIENGIPYVYHAIGGEDNPDEKLRRDTFRRFCDPAHNRGFGIYRYDLNRQELLRLDSAVVSFYKQHIPFDMKFSLQSDDRFYCAEFIYKVMAAVTGDASYIPLSHLPGFSYVAIDNLFLNRHASLICRAAYPVAGEE